MKSILAILVVITATASKASDYRSVMDKLIQIEDTIQDNRRVLSRRDTKAQRVEQILETALKRIEHVLERRGNGAPPTGPINTQPVVNVQLAKIAVSACGELNTWSGRAGCYKEYLKQDNGLLSEINKGCSAASTSTNESKCFKSALDSVVQGIKTNAEAAQSGCSKLNTWSDRKDCFSAMLSQAYDANSQVVTAACNAASTSMNSASCYTDSMEKMITIANPAQIVLAGCSELNTWSDRADCFKKGLDKSDELQMGIKMYTIGCYNLDVSMQAANCFTRALKQIQ